MNRQIGIKVPVDSSIVKVVSVIKKIEPLSNSEIKRRIREDDFLLNYRCASDEEVLNILRCYHRLINMGVKPTLFDQDMPVDIDYIYGLDDAYRIIDEKIKAEIDYKDQYQGEDKIFEYRLSNAWLFPIVSLSVYDRIEENVKCIVWYATGAPEDLPLNMNYSIDKKVIDRITSILGNNQSLFGIKKVKSPWVLDGFSNEFYFRYDDRSVDIDASNIGAWSEPDMTGKLPANIKLLLRVFNEIKKILTDNGVDGRYLRLDWRYS